TCSQNRTRPPSSSLTCLSISFRATGCERPRAQRTRHSINWWLKTLGQSSTGPRRAWCQKAVRVQGRTMKLSIKGTIDRKLVPRVKIWAGGHEPDMALIPFVLDTGFNKSVAISRTRFVEFGVKAGPTVTLDTQHGPDDFGSCKIVVK